MKFAHFTNYQHFKGGKKNDFKMKRGPKGKVIICCFKDNFNMQQSFLPKQFSKFWEKKGIFKRKIMTQYSFFNSLDQNFVKIQPKKSLITLDLGYKL